MLVCFKNNVYEEHFPVVRACVRACVHACVRVTKQV